LGLKGKLCHFSAQAREQAFLVQGAQGVEVLKGGREGGREGGRDTWGRVAGFEAKEMELSEREEGM
jgi:hypothetical protein